MRLGKYESVACSLLAGGLLLLGLVLLPSAAPRTAHAASETLFVSPDGIGTDCSQSTPCTLETALSSAPDGATLYLAQGIYTGTDTAVIVLNQSITLYGGWDGTTTTPPVRDPNAYPTVLDGENQRRVVYIGGSITVTLDGLRLTNGYVIDNDGAGISVAGAHFTLRNCWVYSNTVESTSSRAAGVYVSTGQALLESNRIFGNRGSGIGLLFCENSTVRENAIYRNAGESGGGIQIQGGQALTLTHNLIYSNTASSGGSGCYIRGGEGVLFSSNAVYSNTASSGGGLETFASYTLTLEGNTFHHNTSSGGNGGGLLLYRGDGIYVINNIIADNAATGYGSGIDLYDNVVHMAHNTLARNPSIGVFVTGNATAWMTNTILVSHTTGIYVASGEAHLAGTLWGSGAWANETDWDTGTGSALVVGTVNLWGAPDFVNPDEGNYHIGANSAAIDAGVDSGVTTDIDGDPRPQGSAYDIGADESIGYVHLYLPLVVKQGLRF